MLTKCRDQRREESADWDREEQAYYDVESVQDQDRQCPETDCNYELEEIAREGRSEGSTRAGGSSGGDGCEAVGHERGERKEEETAEGKESDHRDCGDHDVHFGGDKHAAPEPKEYEEPRTLDELCLEKMSQAVELLEEAVAAERRKREKRQGESEAAATGQVSEPTS